jgi:hypothetical protein
MEALTYIESLRPIYVRGGSPFNQEISGACLQNFADAQKIFFYVIGGSRR